MNTSQSRFFCTQCGKEGIPIMRKNGKLREPGHLKKLYCIYCKQEVNHAEVREMGGYTEEDFKKEFEMGRFINGQREILSDCTCDNCPFNINNKCWNSNRQYHCKHRPER